MSLISSANGNKPRNTTLRRKIVSCTTFVLSHLYPILIGLRGVYVDFHWSSQQKENLNPFLTNQIKKRNLVNLAMKSGWYNIKNTHTIKTQYTPLVKLCSRNSQNPPIQKKNPSYEKHTYNPSRTSSSPLLSSSSSFLFFSLHLSK